MFESTEFKAAMPRSAGKAQVEAARLALIKTIADAPTQSTAILPVVCAAAGAFCLAKPDSGVFTSPEASTNWGIGLLVVTALLVIRAGINYYRAKNAEAELVSQGVPKESIPHWVKRYEAQKNEDSCFGSGCDLSGLFR